MARAKISGKKEIVAAAFALVEQEGVEALSARRLAASLNISNMTLYNYVENIDEIKKEIIAEGFRQLYAIAYRSLESSNQNNLALDMKSASKILAEDIFDFGCSNKNIYQLMFANSVKKFREDMELKPFYSYFLQLLPKMEDKEKRKKIHKVLNMLHFIVSQMIMDKIIGIHDYSKQEFNAYVDQFVETMFNFD